MNRLRTRVSDLDRQRRHRSTARAVFRLHPEPESWLDIGTGEAHFPDTARELFPYTAFDGVDPDPRVLWARAVERLEEAHVGALTDPHVAAPLRARYDVVTLLRAPDSREELHAALTVLRPAGLLLLEIPHPQSDVVRAELESHGCDIFATTRLVLDRFATNAHRLIARGPSGRP
ncbi:methyltransferase domain-containing protein [Streptomyces sp. NPDC002766]|uniref:methyltransferase domain-containing protein n=1 Tax=Streptomyces sp. NPDC002766 TaxID=3154429 RepID=UPI00332500D1